MKTSNNKEFIEKFSMSNFTKDRIEKGKMLLKCFYINNKNRKNIIYHYDKII